KNKYVIVTLDRGRANPINHLMITELSEVFHQIEEEEQIKGSILCGKESFFSGGLDIPELYHYNKDEIHELWTKFMGLIHQLIAFPKPLISAITGHSPAGGCLLSLCSDYRVMADGKYVIGLNEVLLGIIPPPLVFDLYAFWLGDRVAYHSLLEGKLFSPTEALKYGLVDEVVNDDLVLNHAEIQLNKYLQFSSSAWTKSKLNFRESLINFLEKDIEESLKDTLQQWWSPETRLALKQLMLSLKK
ncbi:enoyl-CoA hydratase/isomerase family protein, partial [Xanthovirga aplysinae]|uniref:enoyl-CoA hydratase/isomerase family protein n=1 Tax=Xanthovirga aplysinae TaxID=2529853 RepID=UPI0012BD4A21